MTEGVGIVACECEDYLIEADVVRIPAKKEKTNNDVKAGKQMKSHVQYSLKSKKTMGEAVEAAAKKIEKKRSYELYKNVLELPKTGEVSLFKSKNY